jgi:hypothetical protein
VFINVHLWLVPPLKPRGLTRWDETAPVAEWLSGQDYFFLPFLAFFAGFFLDLQQPQVPHMARPS